MKFAHPCKKCSKQIVFDTDFQDVEIKCLNPKCNTVNTYPVFGTTLVESPVTLDRAEKIRLLKKSISCWRSSSRPQEQDIANAVLWILEWIEEQEASNPVAVVDPLPISTYAGLPYHELKTLCAERSLGGGGSKEELIAKLEEADKAVS